MKWIDAVRLRQADRASTSRARAAGSCCPLPTVVGHDDRQRADRPGHRGDADPDRLGLRRDRERRRLDPAASRRARRRPHAAQLQAPQSRLAAVDRELKTMLTGVVDEHGATGNAAQIAGYTVAGKTGTAQIPGPHGYTTGKYVASFVGMVPVEDPASPRARQRRTSRTARSTAASSPRPHSRRSPSSTCSTWRCRRTHRAPHSERRWQPRTLGSALDGSDPPRDPRRALRRDPRPRLRHALGHPGALFFCVAGADADGHDLAAAAVAAGAVALVVERHVDVPMPQVVVPSVRAAMAAGRRALLRRPVARARGRGGHRHERQDDDGVPAPRRSSRRPGGDPGC